MAEFEEESDPIAELWPDGLPPDSAAAWAATIPLKRELTRRRLRAILRYRRREVDATTAAYQAGISVQTLFRLTSIWTEPPTLTDFIPNYRERLAERPGAHASEDLKARIKTVVAQAEDGASKESLVRMIADADPGAPALSTLRRLVAAEMTARRRRMAAFGRGILVDASIVDMPFGGGGVLRSVVDMVIDEESGLIMTLKRGEPTDHVYIRWMAMLDGVRRWSAEHAPVSWRAAAGKPTLRIAVPELEGVRALRFLAQTGELEGLDWILDGERRNGHRLDAALDRRIGRMLLRPRLSPNTGFQALDWPEGSEVPSRQDFDRIAELDVSAHNQSILEAGVSAHAAPAAIVIALEEAFAAPRFGSADR